MLNPLVKHTSALKKLIILNLMILGVGIVFFNSCSDDVIQNENLSQGVWTNDYIPSWSSDGHTIAYYHFDYIYEKKGIYLIDTDGTNKRLLINGDANEPDFSPDGNWITFIKGQIYKIKTNGDSLIRISEYYGSFPSWSPDGNYITFSYDSLYKVKSDGTDIRSICKCGENASWSPNGRTLVFKGYASGNIMSEIFIVDTSGQIQGRITNNNNPDNYPRFSPDNQKIIFTQGNETILNYQICKINIDGTGFARLTNTQGYTADYSPDGEKIVYCDSSPDNGFLWIMNKDGTNKKQLTFP